MKPKIFFLIIFSCGKALCGDFSQKDLGFIEDEPFSFYTPELLQGAEQGNPRDQFQLSRCLEFGWGIPVDKNESKKWLLKSVESNYPPSLYIYANQLINIENSSKDYEKAITLLEKAHNQKYFKATTALMGIFWDNSYDPTDQKPKKYINIQNSNKLLLEAANAGEAYAQHLLGNRIIFKNQIEDLVELTSVDPAEGIKWLEKSAYKLDANAAGELAAIYRYGQNEIQKNTKLQHGWEKRFFDILKRVVAFNEGMGGSWERTLATYYLEGRGTDKNEAKAFIHMYNAALEGDFKAIYEVGYLFEKGIGIPKNMEEALKWYKKCKEDPVSFRNLKRDFNEDPKWKESVLATSLVGESESSTNPQ
jgi:TPR repeat protein